MALDRVSFFILMKDETNKKVSENRKKKEAIVAVVAEKAKKAKAVVFTNYEGMTHMQMEKLKKGLKTADAELVVTKNTLLKIALEQGLRDNFTLDALPYTLDGPTATLYTYGDPMLALKELAKSIKTLKLPSIKFGIFSTQGGSASGRESTIYNADQIMQLMTLPSREVLLAQLAGALKSPIYALHRALNWNLQKFVMTLKAIEVKKS